MRILVHDYGAYSFPLELSVELSRRGHIVMHLCHVDTKHPRSAASCRAAGGLTIAEIGRPYDKYSLAAKPYNDYRYGQQVRSRMLEFRPDAVLSSNTPLNAQAVIRRAARLLGARFVYWQQDIIAEGIHVALSQRSLTLAHLSRSAFGLLERRLLRHSDFVVAASPDFVPSLTAYGVPSDRVRVIENWAPMSDVTPAPQVNDWSQSHGLAGKRCVFYTGTLGLKHNPRFFIEVARELAALADAWVVLVSEGPGADWLKLEIARSGVPRLLVLPLQPYTELSSILGTASVLLSVVGNDASRFCFPSKTLTYLCANRPVVLAAPKYSYLARKLDASGAALVVSPDSPHEVAGAIARLFDDNGFSGRLASRALAYARREFDVAAIANQFESVFNVCGQERQPRMERR